MPKKSSSGPAKKSSSGPAKKKQRVPSRLEELPNELHDTIYDYFKDDLPQLRALRLTCKKINDIVLRYPYQNTYLNMDAASWEKLNKIAGNPVLTVCVERILCETGRLPALANEEAWRKVLEEEGYTDLSDEQVDWFYGNFESLHTAEEQLLSSLDDPELGLQSSQLPNLRSIETVYAPPDDSRKKQQDTLIPASKWVRDNTHLMLLLRAVEQNKRPLSELKFIYFVSSSSPQPDHHITDFADAIKYLTKLDMAFFDFGRSPDLGLAFLDVGGAPDPGVLAKADSRQFAKWLGAATQLEVFKFEQQPSPYNSRLSLIQALNLRKQTWPKLKTVHFKNTLDKIDDIVVFLSKHVSSLREVHIINAGRRGTTGVCWLESIKNFPRLQKPSGFIFRKNVLGNMLPKDVQYSFEEDFPGTEETRDRLEDALNKEIQHISRYRQSSSDSQRESVLGAYFPKFVSDETKGNSIEINGLDIPAGVI